MFFPFAWCASPACCLAASEAEIVDPCAARKDPPVGFSFKIHRLSEDSKQIREGGEDAHADVGVDPADVAAGPPAGSRLRISSRTAGAVAAWRRQVVGAVAGRPRLAALLEGLGEVFGAIHQQRRAFSEAVLSFVFQGVPASPTSPTSPASPGTMSPGGGVTRVTSWKSWADVSLVTEQEEQRSLRLSQRRGQPLRLEDGTSLAPCVLTSLTAEALEPGDAEVLLARKTTCVRIVDGRIHHEQEDESPRSTPDSPAPGSPGAASLSPLRMTSWTLGDARKRGTNVTDFAMIAQFATTPFIFRTAVDICQRGPLSSFLEQGLSCDEALRALAEVWPKTAAFMKKVVDSPSVSLQTKPAPHGCVQVALGAPLDVKSIAQHFPSVANLVRIVRSCRVRFTDRRSSDRSGSASSTAKPVASSAMRQGLALNYEDGEFWMHFLVCGKHVAWTDETGQPIVEGGTVAVVESPVAQQDTPTAKDLTLYCLIDEFRLRLSDFGCIGFSSLPLPDITLRLDISTWPESLDGASEPPAAVDPQEVPLAATVAFHIVEVTAFPAEALVRPLFDVRLLRTLLALTFELSWTVGPFGPNGEWQLLQVIRTSIPKVARAFKACFRAFAQAQVRESDWLKLLAGLFAASAEDMSGFEAAAAEEACQIAGS